MRPDNLLSATTSTSACFAFSICPSCRKFCFSLLVEKKNEYETRYLVVYDHEDLRVLRATWFVLLVGPYVYVCMYVCIHTHRHTHRHTHTHTHTGDLVCPSCRPLYMYTHIHTHTHTHIKYVYMYIYRIRAT